MTETRPSLARRHTRGTEKARNTELDRGIRITVEGDVFEVRVGDVTPALAAEFRRQTGMSFNRLMETIAQDPDIDVLTAFEWLARRVRGESDVELSDVEFSYADMMSDEFDVSEAGAVEPDKGDDPEV